MINYLNAADQDRLKAVGVFLDVSGDESVSPLDALLVINFLNSGEGEGEQSADIAVPATTWWQVADMTTQEPVGARSRVERQSRDWKVADFRQSTDFLQSLDLLYAKFDEAQHTRTGAAAARRDKPAGDLEEFLDAMLSGGADEEKLFATAFH